MPRGGRREGAGRKKGSSHAMREAYYSKNGTLLMPLDYMLQVLRDPKTPEDIKREMAKAAAPYVHPKLVSAQVKGDVSHTATIEHRAVQAIDSRIADLIGEFREIPDGQEVVQDGLVLPAVVRPGP